MIAILNIFKKLVPKRKGKIFSSVLIFLILVTAKPAFSKIENNSIASNEEKNILAEGQELKITYEYKKHPRLVSEAQKLSWETKKEISSLLKQLPHTYINDTEQIKELKNVFVLRGKNNTFIFFRKNSKSFEIEILAESTVFNKPKIIGLLKEFNY